MAFKRPPFPRKNPSNKTKQVNKTNQNNRVWQIGKITINRALRIPVLIFIAIIVYSTLSVLVNHYNPVKTTVATQMILDDSFSTSGYFIRDENIIDIAEGDTVQYNYSDGDKVAKGASLVTEYKNEDALTISRELKNIRDNINQLETLRTASTTNTNSNQLNQKIIAQMNVISDEAESASLRQISSLTSELRQLSLKSSSLQGGNKDVEAELVSLRAQESELENRLEGKTTSITSPHSGYFCETIDGYESVLTPDIVEDLTLSSLDKLVNQKKSTPSDKGKIISSYSWYFAAKVNDAQTKHLTQGNSVALRFAQTSQDVKATVHAIRDDVHNDQTLVIFQSQDMNEDLVSMRKQAVTVIIDTYSGLKVPKSAVRMENDEMGVYVLSDSVSRYKKIEPLFEGEDFYIVKQNVTGNDSLVADDDIITEAKDLDDKKVVK